MYAVTATLSRTTVNGTVTHQLPTFYLNRNVQGLMSTSDAVRCAIAILDPFGDHGSKLQVYALEV